MEGLAEYTRAAQEKGFDPATWASGVCSALSSAGESIPSECLAHALVSHICWANDVPLAWKYLDRALSSTLAPPLLVLALLSARVVPRRYARPVAYRLYMELIRRHTISFASQCKRTDVQKMMTSIDDALHLSQMFSIQPPEPGVLVVEFVFYILVQLIDATIEDEGLEETTSEKRAILVSRAQDMEIDQENEYDKRTEPSEKLQRSNGTVAIELIGHFFQQRVTYKLLCLVRKNMPSQWNMLIHRIHLLVMNPIIFRNSTVSADNLLQLALQEQNRFSIQQKSIQIRDLFGIGSYFSSMPPGSYCHGVSPSSLWIPFDLFLEDCIDGAVAATNAIEIISGLIKSLHAVNGTAWHDAFLGLWIASLRLVQRERDPIEGPVPGLDSRLCILLSITTLAIADIVEEETFIDEEECIPKWKEKSASGERRKDLVTSLQILGDYESLLVPPPSVVSAANQAAVKAMIFVSGQTSGSGFFDAINTNENMNLMGNMWHLIVEACISRNLLDTSAYYWSGYITGNVIQLPFSISNKLSSWPALMNGAPLTSSMVNVLENTPASSLAELEKLFEIAVNGSDDDKASAAAVLCGASLVRGWNIQEHTVHFVVKLLSPAVPVDYTGCDSHLIGHAPMLNVILTRISPVDCVQVFSCHGLVPELAGALMAICEVFGSCVPSISWIVGGEEINAHSVFSNAFILLLRLWKFNHPSLEYCIMGDGAPVGSQLTPEYLLLLRNSRVLSGRKTIKDRTTRMQVPLNGSSSFMHPIFVDSFPQLKVWYRQHQACLASTLSGLVHGSPFHQNVESLLNMMFWKMGKGHTPSVGPGTSGSSSLSSSSGTGSDDLPIRPKLPAWEIMEAVPFVVDAVLTACSHGMLSPRELATGLKDLADFLPSSLATIVSYFSAEVTRGVWKPAHMNGSDWPSPAANLSYVEELIKKIVAATGADVPSLVVGGSSSASLPLPLAAFVSLTITYKLDKASERFLNLAGPALENLAASCPWPSMPIVAALWSQKVKRWSDFLVFSASRTVFHHNNDAVLQLVRSCFTATLGLSLTPNSSNGGVGSLLGHGFGSHFSGGLSPVAPGILYLRIYRCLKDIILLSEQILYSLMLAVKDIAENVLNKQVDQLRKGRYGTSCGKASLASAMTQVKVAALLGAMLLWLSGGSSLVQALIQEILPSWFLSVHEFDDKARDGGVLYMLEGHALAYFAVLCGMFAWGVDATPVSRHRPRIISSHLKFLASALDGKISIACDGALWCAYMSGFVELIVECAPSWLMEVELDVIKRLSRGLRQWNQEELALALLGRGGIGAMGVAADMIIFGSE